MSVDCLAKILWDYALMKHEISKADCIIVFGSHDIRVAERGTELYSKGFAPLLVFTGGLGRLTEGVWDRPEAHIFSEVALKAGVPEGKIIIEDRSANTGENILFARELLGKRGIYPEKIIGVQKPYMERRLYAAIRNYWPETEVCVTSPQLSYEEYCSNLPAGHSKEDIINVIVGDLERVKIYPEMGFQIYQEIPEKVWDAFNELVGLGYTKQLIKS